MQHASVVLYNESRKAFDTLFESYRADWNPHGIVETDEVMNLVNSRWRLQRIWSMQTAARNAGFASVLPMLHRYEKHYSKMYRSSLETLLLTRTHLRRSGTTV